MIAIKCKDLTISGNVEEKMGAAGFDIGDSNHRVSPLCMKGDNL